MVGQETYSVDISRPAVVSSFEPTGSKEESQHTNLNVEIVHRVAYSELTNSGSWGT